MDRLPRVKEKRTYKRFDLMAFLAVLGCAGMILFECFFIFEVYGRAVEASSFPAPVVNPPAEAVPAPGTIPVVPAEKTPGVEPEPALPAITVPVG